MRPNVLSPSALPRVFLAASIGIAIPLVGCRGILELTDEVTVDAGHDTAAADTAAETFETAADVVDTATDTAPIGTPAESRRTRDGSGAWRFDARAINGRFDIAPGVHIPDRWFSVTSSGSDVSVKLADINGVRLATGEVTLSPKCTGECIVSNSYYPFKGRFSTQNVDDYCTYYRRSDLGAPFIQCWTRFEARMHWSYPNENGTAFAMAMPTTNGKTSASDKGQPLGFAIGDFDGDGYDEVLTYDAPTGANPRIWRYHRTNRAFERYIPLSDNLMDRVPDASDPVVMYTGNIDDTDGPKTDDLILYHTIKKTIEVFGSRVPGGGSQRFWGAYTARLRYPLTDNDELTMARFDANGYDALVVNTYAGSLAGTIRAYDLATATPALIVTAKQGDIPHLPASSFTGEAHLIWADLGEHDPLRDDAIQFQTTTNRYFASDARPGTSSAPGTWSGSFDGDVARLRSALGL
jgi:hypothetical protein